jgi:DNA polymerase-3 subunit alpha
VRLEGTIRSNGVHAAGVVIAPEPIVAFAPMQRAQKGGLATQYSMGPVEELGLLKMDFLGLSNLTVINNALRIIKRVYGKSIDIATIPLEDAKTFELLAAGDTTGVFQLESAGMKRYLRELKPTVFDDIIAMVALYRPGPMQWIEDFINRKHGIAEITYVHPSMENALKNTYGILVYQEQVMQISKEVSGFTGGEADTLRKAIGKKNVAMMQKMKEKFIDGAIKLQGADKKMMEEFWSGLEDFAAYCFNKSHAACYGLIAYQTAYLKAHYPAAFMAALMTSDYGNIERIAIEVAECTRMNMPVLPPDVNESFGEFAVVKGTNNIRFGLSAVKNVGGGPIETIIAARESGGPFTSIEDFAKRVSAKDCNKKVWESLTKCGAFDALIDGQRATLLHNLDTVTAYAAKAQKNALSGQIDIFGSLGAEENLPGLRMEVPAAQATSREQLAWEKELLGLYISHHPLDEYAGYLADMSQPIGEVVPGMDGKLVRLGGIITTVRKILTKKGDAMAFVGLEDKTGTTELIVFPKAYEKSPEVFEADNVIMATGKISSRDKEGNLTSEPKMMVDSVKIINYETAKSHVQSVRPAQLAKPTPAPARSAQVAEIPITGEGYVILHLSDLSDQQLLHDIKEVVSSHQGPSDIYIVVGDNDPKKIRLPFKVNVSSELIANLGTLVGPAQVTHASANL